MGQTGWDGSVALDAGEGERVGIVVIKVDRPELTLLDTEVPPGVEVDPHLHRVQSDSFYVVDGELEFTVGDRRLRATAGSYVHAPAGVVHGFRNIGDRTARLVNIHVPGGFAEYVREAAALRAAGVELDTAFYERHDVFDPS